MINKAKKSVLAFVILNSFSSTYAESLQDLHSEIGNETAYVISGAGISGLSTAILLRKHFDTPVVLIEKRDSFTRENVINIAPEAMDFFLEAIAEDSNFAKLKSHNLTLINSSQSVLLPENTENAHQKLLNRSASRRISVNSMIDFGSSGTHSIPIKELQQLLLQKATEYGVYYMNNCEISEVDIDSDFVTISSLKSPNELPVNIKYKRLIVSEGSASKLTQKLFKINEKPTEQCWAFANYQYGSDNPQNDSFVQIYVDYTENSEKPEIANCIYNGLHQKLNVAVTINPSLENEEQVMKKLDKYAHKKIEDVTVSDFPLSSPAKAQIFEKKSHAFRKNNCLVIGDSAGTGSPMAGLGASLSMSIYPYAVFALEKKLDFLCKSDAGEQAKEQAFSAFEKLIGTAVDRWHNKSKSVYSAVLNTLKAMVTNH